MISAPAPADTPSLDAILERNIQALMARRKEEEAAVTKHEGFATAVGRFIGSFGFVAVWPLGSRQHNLYGRSAAVEAIFLTTLVLINQNRMSAAADKRAELDLKISLLTEHELTRMLHLVSAVADRSKVDEEIEELKRDVAVGAVLDKIENADAAEGESSKEDAPPQR